MIKGGEIGFCLLRHVTDEAGYPVLHEAVMHGNEEMYNLLVENGGGEKKRDKENRTILHVVAEYNRDDLVWRLTSEENTEFAAQDNNGLTPLHQAVMSNSDEVAEALLQRGEYHVQCIPTTEGSCPWLCLICFVSQDGTATI